MALNRPNNNDHLRTPSPSRHGNTLTLTTDAEMTPFTRHLSQLITEANTNGAADQSFHGSLDELGMNLGEGFDFDISQLGGDAFRFSDFSHEGVAALTGQGCVGSVAGTGASSVSGSLDIEFYEDPVQGDVKLGGVAMEMKMESNVDAAAVNIDEKGGKFVEAVITRVEAVSQ